MMKIRALNRESSSDEDVPVIRREAQEEIALELYNKALRLQPKGELDRAKEILETLINENIPDLENNGGLPKSMSTLKYSCYINLGNIYLKQDEVNRALESYLSASELDSTDVTLWHKIGKLSLKENKFRQAAYAFSKGTECSESHWPCLDQVISVLYAIKDTVGCLVYIGKALILDPNYVKGLVLRKQIYLDNPATKEYYKLFNPDHIWEPSIDVEIDKEDEEEVLQEIKILCDKVTAVEKSFEPKPLETIPLPKTLDEYTWVSLAKTIICIHQYITDNGMTHFTFLDMSRCMSQKMEVEELEIPVQSEPQKETNDEIIKETPEVVVQNGTEEKMEAETITERRVSQTSENTNNDLQENTPVQTDNDEEQMNEPDTEDQDENGEPKTEKNRQRGTKRKRDVLSELQIWGWHSKRKPPKKVTKDFTIEDALNRIVPKTLLKEKISNEFFNQVEDSMNTMDIYNMYVDDRELIFLSPIHSPKSGGSESYFGSDREKEDVLEFWTKKRRYVDAIVLVKNLVFDLAKLSHYKWPKPLVNLYIEAFNMFREHCDPPQVFCGGHTFDEIKNDALATLLYGELLTFSSESKEELHPTYLNYLQTVSGFEEHWKDEYSSIFIRTFWLRSHIFRKEDDNDLAASSLQLILEIIEREEEKKGEQFFLSLPNCFKCSVITRAMIERILNHLKIINSLGEIELLYNLEKYTEVAEIIKKTFETGSKPRVGKMGRPAQLAMLMHSLWFTDMTECFIWTEECLIEALENYKKFNSDFDKWEKIVEKCISIFYEIIKTETITVIDALSEENRSRLVESLCKIVCKQLNTDGSVLPFECVTPWILLHYILTREEQRQYAQKRSSLSKKDRVRESSPELSEEELPPSIAILFSAHEFLGPKGWCLTNQGELAHFILDTILDRLDTPVFEGLRDKIDVHLEQCLFCLYQYPSKKNKISRHLIDHNIDPLPLTWERSFQLYQYYGPDCLPEYNSYKNASISADLEQLLKRIIALVPLSYDIQNLLPKIVDYINGKSDQIPEPLEFPNRMRAIYYLIGDYYFKQREFSRCLKYFQQDLCINPYRLDSWACLGLSYAAQLDTKLNHCEKLKSEMDFLEKAKSAQICFRKALELAPDHLTLWIECGSFEYTVHSFCSRLLKYESENLSMDKFEILENQKNSYLDSSGNSLEQAISLYELEDTNEPDERWLQYYLLGKIAEKKQREPTEYLQYYMTASTLLDENQATYPDKINYNNPQHLAVEVLELHYRINASVLKYLELHEGKDIPNTLGTFFKKCVSSSKFLKIIHQKAKQKQSSNVVATGVNVATNVVNATTNAANATANGTTDSNSVPVSTSSNTSFQEQFLNSLKLAEEERLKMAAEIEAEEEIKRDVEACLNAILTKIEKETESDVIIVEEQAQEVIFISDSDEETEKPAEKIEETIKQEEKKEEEKEEEKVPNVTKPENIQDVLDRMMEETMKETEKEMNDMETDLSGTEQVEEVVVKETKNDNKEEKVEKKSKKVKPSDSETDTDNQRTSIEEDDSSSTSSSSSSSSSSSDSDSDEDGSSSSSSSSENTNENMTNSEVSQLIDRCVQGLEICITRLPQNYKALYRLAHLFLNYKPKKDIAKCKQLLLSEYKCKDGSIVTGLFAERNTKNFFNGIWRIPSTEIDRPGSLSAHMSRCIMLLMQILRTTSDNKTLMELCMQLRRVPDPDKVYIRDSERMAFSEQALTMCVQSMRTQMKNIPNMTNTQTTKLLQDIFRLYQRVQKHLPAKENVFSNLLVDAYKQFIKEKVPDNVNILDIAIKFCQQNRPTEKCKIIPSANLVTPRGPGMAMPPVLPSPSTLIQPQKPVQRLSGGRPRGRPPLPKVPGQPRSSRAKNPMANNPYTSAWQKSLLDQSFAYEYLKHYQDELIKQYSQNLSISQMAQLGQLMAQGQISNPMTAAAITSQMLSQTNLLNQSSLSKQMSSVASSGISTTTTNSTKIMEAFNQLNPPVKKPADTVSSTPTKVPTFTPDQLKYFNSMLSTMTPPSKSTKASISPQPLPKTKPVFSTQQTPSTSTLSNTTVAFSKPVSTVTTKTNVANVKTHSNPTKFSTADILKLNPNIPPKPTVPQPVFKEPVKAHQSSTVTSLSPEEKSANMLLKDRPSISITPVSLTNVPPVTTSPNFGRSINTSPGKTLQEKLADKKKELQNKHMMKNIEADIFPAETKNLKGLNIPSSLTVSKTNLPNVPATFPINPPQPKQKYPHDIVVPTIPFMPMKPLPFTKEIPVANPFPTPKFAPDFNQRQLPSPKVPSPSFAIDQHKLPSSLTVSKAAVKFPVDTSKVSSKHSSSKPPSKIVSPEKFLNIPKSSGIAVNISPVHSKDTTSSVKKSSSSLIKKKIDFQKKASSGKVIDSEKNRVRKDLSPSVSIVKASNKKDRSKNSDNDVICID